MRRIEILDNLRLHFPARDGEFDLGVEVGSLAVLMALGEPSIRRVLSEDSVEQLRPLAENFRYRLVATPRVDGALDVSLASRAFERPRLQLVSNTAAVGG